MQGEERAQWVAEVLELGEELFELALVRTPSPQSAFLLSVEVVMDKQQSEAVNEDEDKDYPVEELRAAKNEFFATVRALLEGDGGIGESRV